VKNKLISQFINEGLMGDQGQMIELPKIDANLQQNTSTSAKPPTLNPTPEKPQENKANPSMDSTKPTNDKQDDVSSKYISEVKAAAYGLHLAEYHMDKMNEMKSLSEIEDVDLEKVRKSRDVITDCKKTLHEIVNKMKAPK
jgi:hypothetical protein